MYNLILPITNIPTPSSQNYPVAPPGTSKTTYRCVRWRRYPVLDSGVPGHLVPGQAVLPPHQDQRRRSKQGKRRFKLSEHGQHGSAVYRIRARKCNFHPALLANFDLPTTDQRTNYRPIDGQDVCWRDYWKCNFPMTP